MSTRLRFVAAVSVTVLALPVVSVTAGSAAGTPIPLPDPRPHLHLLAPPLDVNTAVLTELQQLRDEYAATHLPGVHNAIVLIINSPDSAVL